MCVYPNLAYCAVPHAENYEELFHWAQKNSTVAENQKALQGWDWPFSQQLEDAISGRSSWQGADRKAEK